MHASPWTARLLVDICALYLALCCALKLYVGSVSTLVGHVGCVTSTVLCTIAMRWGCLNHRELGHACTLESAGGAVALTDTSEFAMLAITSTSRLNPEIVKTDLP